MVEMARSVRWAAWVAAAAILASCSRVGVARWLPSVSVVALAQRETGRSLRASAQRHERWSFGAELWAQVPTHGRTGAIAHTAVDEHGGADDRVLRPHREVPCASVALCRWERTARVAADQRLGGLR